MYTGKDNTETRRFLCALSLSSRLISNKRVPSGKQSVEIWPLSTVGALLRLHSAAALGGAIISISAGALLPWPSLTSLCSVQLCFPAKKKIKNTQLSVYSSRAGLASSWFQLPSESSQRKRKRTIQFFIAHLLNEPVYQELHRA